MKVVMSSAHERAETYVRLLRDLPGVEVAVADPDDPAWGRSTSRRLGVACAQEELFAPGPRVVVVTSKIARRRELVGRAARAGAQVLCEPPLAATEADAQAMVDACAAAGVRLTLASPACFSPAFTAVRTAIADDAVVGRLMTVHGALHSSMTTEKAADGALAANAPFLLDMVDAVLGGEPAEQVYAQSNGILSAEPGVESAALVTVRYPSGVVAAIDCSWSRSAHQPTMTFIGERASVEFNACPRLLGGFDSATAGERWEPGGIDLDSIMLNEFLAAAGNGHPVGPDGTAGVRALRVIQAAAKSVETGRPIDIG